MGVMRYCLNNYLLAGEGQSVERAIKCISTKLAKRLNLDFKSVQITVGAMLMLNTQFICERNGKKLNTYMSADDFIDMVQSYPGFVKEQFPAESLTQIYDSLKAKPLGVQIPGCVVFNSAGLLVADPAYFAEGFQLIQIAQKVKLDYLKQKINFNQLDYFYQDIDRLEREEKLVGISFGQTDIDIREQFIPVLLQFCLLQVTESNSKDLVNASFSMLYQFVDMEFSEIENPAVSLERLGQNLK